MEVINLDNTDINIDEIFDENLILKSDDFECKRYLPQSNFLNCYINDVIENEDDDYNYNTFDKKKIRDYINPYYIKKKKNKYTDRNKKTDFYKNNKIDEESIKEKENEKKNDITNKKSTDILDFIDEHEIQEEIENKYKDKEIFRNRKISEKIQKEDINIEIDIDLNNNNENNNENNKNNNEDNVLDNLNNSQLKNNKGINNLKVERIKNKRRSPIRDRKNSYYNTYCSNCGYRGHIYSTCNEPLTSYGLICFRKICDRNRLDIYNYQIVLIRRKHTIGYVEFLRGKYNVNNTKYIQRLFNLMTIEEKNKIEWVKDFDKLRTDLGMTRNYKNNSLEYDDAKLKFNFLLTNNKLDYYCHCCKNEWEEPEWGIPKGRRNNIESNIDCAIREFNEETGINTDNIKIFKNVRPLEEIYVGINNIKYKHIYYFSLLDDKVSNVNEDIIPLDDNNLNQKFEVSQVRWVNYYEIKNMIRYYYSSKINILKKAFQLINNINYYFEF